MEKLHDLSTRLLHGIDVTECLEELINLDCPRHWYAKINNFPHVFGSHLNVNTTPLIQRLCDKLDIPFDEILSESARFLEQNSSHSSTQEESQTDSSKASSSDEKNLEEVIARVKARTAPKRIIPILQPHDLRPKTRRSTRVALSTGVNSFEPTMGPAKKTSLFKKCERQVNLMTMQYSKRK